MRIEGQDGAKQTLGSENILLLYGEGEGDKEADKTCEFSSQQILWMHRLNEVSQSTDPAELSFSKTKYMRGFERVLANCFSSAIVAHKYMEMV